MKFFLNTFCIILVLGLLGCQGIQKNSLVNQPMEQCKLTCAHHLEFCKQNCVNNCPNCSGESLRRTQINYMNYVHEKNIEGKKVMRELNSYRDPLQCRKVSCDCISDFAICTHSCTGLITMNLQPIPYCT